MWRCGRYETVCGQISPQHKNAYLRNRKHVLCFYRVKKNEWGFGKSFGNARQQAIVKHVIENSGVLRKLLLGDIVLADRGFDIADSVGFYQAKLYIPAFTVGKKQLSAQEVEETTKLVNVRIHVERVIGLVRRKYVILQSILPTELVKAKPGESLAPMDEIVLVCCALAN